MLLWQSLPLMQQSHDIDVRTMLLLQSVLLIQQLYDEMTVLLLQSLLLVQQLHDGMAVLLRQSLLLNQQLLDKIELQLMVSLDEDEPMSLLQIALCLRSFETRDDGY